MYEVYVEKFFAPLMGSRGYSSDIRVFPDLTETEAKEMVKVLEKEWKPLETEQYSFYVSFRKMRVLTQSPVAQRNQLRRDQISLIRQAQFHVGEALEKFNKATSKRASITDKLGDLLVDMDLEMEMIHEEME